MAALLISCGGVGFVYEERLTGDVALIACDVREDMVIGELKEWGADVLVPDTVFAVGWNDRHLIAKRHPREDFRMDRSRTEFYLIDLRTREVYGPLNEDEFALHREVHRVAEELAFRRILSDLE